MFVLVVLYVHHTWSLISRQDHRLTVFENNVLRRKSVPNGEEVIEELPLFSHVSFFLPFTVSGFRIQTLSVCLAIILCSLN
jgi:hypothetical protein